MYRKKYKILKLESNLSDIANDIFWQGIAGIKIEDYLWMQNSYQPEVFVQACYSNEYIYLKFLVFEQKVTIRYLNIGDPVFKDSCVEFFVNLFPHETQQYFNLELNAIGTIKMGYGIKRNREYLAVSDLNDIKVVTSITKPVEGFHGSANWKLYCAVPIKVLEKYAEKAFRAEDAIGNFYKCGDETEFKHYGMWNPIENPTPDFHLPDYFGKIVFLK